MSNQVREMERRFREREKSLDDAGRFSTVTFALTTIFYLLVPVVGFAVGSVYLLQEDEDVQREGVRYMGISFINFVALLLVAAWLWWPS